MLTDLIIISSLLSIAITMFVINRPRMDAVALIMLAALPLTGVITIDDALAGFSDPNIILMALLFVIGDALARTGVAKSLGDWLLLHAGRSETRVVTLLMLIVGGITSFMSSTGVVAIFIPVVLRIARKSGLSPSILMMPLSVAALVGGMMTLVATPPNLMIHSELLRQGYDGFQLFSFTPLGLPLLVVAILYMLVSRSWIRQEADTTQDGDRPSLDHWVKEYSLAEHILLAKVSSESPLCKAPLHQLGFRQEYNTSILAIERNANQRKTLVRPNAQTVLAPGDVLLIDVLSEGVDTEEFAKRFSLSVLPLQGTYFNDHTQDVGMAEYLIPTTSKLIGKTVIESEFRAEFGTTVIGIKQGTHHRSQHIEETPFRAGDTVLVIGSWTSIQKIHRHRQHLILLTLPSDIDDVVPLPEKKSWAIAALVVMVLLMVTGVVSNVQAALLACLLLGAFGCMGLTTAYQAIHWQTIVLIVGMLPFSIALKNTGGIEVVANSILLATGFSSPVLALGATFVMTAMLSMFISNTATAILIAPVAITIAEHLQVSPYPFAMMVALAASSAFLTPVASPVNALVVHPGHYRFMDFVKIGAPLSLLMLIVSMILVPLVFPF